MPQRWSLEVVLYSETLVPVTRTLGTPLSLHIFIHEEEVLPARSVS